MTLAVDKSTWTKMRFEDFVQSVTDRVDDPSTSGVDRYVGLEHLDPGAMIVSRWGSPDEVEAQKLRFRSGDVIFGRRRAYQRKVARADFDGICSAHALVLRARPERVHPDFLPVFLSSDLFLDRAIKISVGSLSPTVNWRDLKVQEFLLPPLAEQQRIADLMWAADAAVKAQESLSRSLRYSRERALVQMFRDHDGAAKKSFGELATFINGFPFKPADLGITGLPVVRIKQLLNPLEPLDRSEVDVPERVRLSDGDLVFSWSGVLSVRVWNRGPAILNQHLFRAVEKTGVSRAWLALALENSLGELELKAHGSTMKHLTKPALLGHEVPVPKPEEQLEVVETIAHFDRSIEATNDSIKSLKELRSGLVAKLFGEYPESGEAGVSIEGVA